MLLNIRHFIYFRVCQRSEIEISGLEEFAKLVEAISDCMTASIAGNPQLVDGMDKLFTFLQERALTETIVDTEPWKKPDTAKTSETFASALEMMCTNLEENSLEYFLKRKEMGKQHLIAAARFIPDISQLQQVSGELSMHAEGLGKVAAEKTTSKEEGDGESEGEEATSNVEMETPTPCHCREKVKPAGRQRKRILVQSDSEVEDGDEDEQEEEKRNTLGK